MKEVCISKLLTLVVILGVVSGCAAVAPKQTMEEMSILREQRIEVATHKFDDTKREDVEKAIFEVFNLLDGGDVKIDLRTNKMLLSRSWMYYAVLTGGIGRDYWEFTIKEAGDEIEVVAAFEAEEHHGMFAIPASTDFKDNISIGGNARNGASVADYDLLYARIEYILGTNNTWSTCDDIATKHNVIKSTMVLCDGIGIEDRQPE